MGYLSWIVIHKSSYEKVGITHGRNGNVLNDSRNNLNYSYNIVSLSTCKTNIILNVCVNKVYTRLSCMKKIPGNFCGKTFKIINDKSIFDRT